MKNSTELINYFQMRKKALGEKATNLNMFLEGYAIGYTDTLEYITNKACEWIKFYGEKGNILFPNWEEDFRKTMEKNK